MVVDVKHKAVIVKGGVVYLTIKSDEEYIQYILKQTCYKNSPDSLFFLKPNPCYDVNVVSNKEHSESSSGFVLKPKIGQKYQLKNSSNGDRACAGCEIIFDSLNNMKVIIESPADGVTVVNEQ